MRKEDKELTFLLVLVLALGMWLGLLASCSPQYHMAKFIKKGGITKLDTITFTISDTIRVNGKDSIIYRTFNKVCPEMKSPKTRYETRIEYRYKTKVEKAQIKYQIKYIKQQRKADKVNTRFRFKQENKNNKTLNLLLIVLGLITLTILAFKFSK
jgi:hypothetical protein